MDTEIQKKWFGVSKKLLMLTIIFVMLAEVLIYVPSIAQFRNNWLGDRLAAARIAALVIESSPSQSMPDTTIQQMLQLLQAKTITLKMGGTRRLLGVSNTPPMIDRQFDLRNPDLLTSISETFDTIFAVGLRTLNIMGPAPMGGDFVDIVIEEAPLKQAMLDYSINILLVSLIISSTTAALLYLALRLIIIAPMSRILYTINNFAKDPEKPGHLIAPTTTNDELGLAELALYKMQATISTQFKEKQRLAALGLAVSKINHDLRNMLASVQLFSDRLADLPDPTVQRLAPKLMSALNRAIHFCESTLSFGKASETEPKPEHFRLAGLINDVREVLSGNNMDWQINVPDDYTVYADQEHLFRVFTNLLTNSILAVKSVASPCINILAKSENGLLSINICDNGSGIPETMKPRLFQAFNGSGKTGSTGLGLAIAAELVKANHGTIKLAEAEKGTCFKIMLPIHPVSFTVPSYRPYQCS